MKKIGFIGAGNVGTALGVALRECGYQLSGYASRTYASSKRAVSIAGGVAYNDPVMLARDSEVVFLTTPDMSIEVVCRYLVERGALKKGQLVVHTSGAHSTSILQTARSRRASVLSLHPLQTIPDYETGVKNLPGSFFALEGDEEGIIFGRELVDRLEGFVMEIPLEKKALYHAAACVASNYFVSVVNLAVRMMEESGVNREHSLKALLPLIEGSLNNIKKIGVPAALTGPIARGDLNTISSHLETMNKLDLNNINDNYVHIGKYTVQVALEKGSLSEKQAEELNRILGGESNE